MSPFYRAYSSLLTKDIFLTEPKTVAGEQYPEENDALGNVILQSFTGLGNQENTYPTPSLTCLAARWEIELNGLTPKPIESLMISKKTERYKHAPVKKADRVQSVSLSIYVRCKIKKLHELLLWRRNHLYIVKCSHSGASQASFLLKGWLQSMQLTWTSQEHTMTWK